MQEAGAEAQDGDRRADLRGGAGRRLLQHGGRDRRRRHVPRQVPQDPHPALQAGLLGEVLLPPGNLGYPVFETGLRARSASTSATTATSPKARAPRPERRRDRLQPVGHRRRACREYLWKLEQPAHAVANGYFVGAINRVGVRGARGTSASSTARATSATRAGQIVAEAPRDKDEIVVADLDLDMIHEVRNTWQFYRDRRPDTYGPLVAP